MILKKINKDSAHPVHETDPAAKGGVCCHRCT